MTYILKHRREGALARLGRNGMAEEKTGTAEERSSNSKAPESKTRQKTNNNNIEKKKGREKKHISPVSCHLVDKLDPLGSIEGIHML
jgi:hypothetical protein